MSFAERTQQVFCYYCCSDYTPTSSSSWPYCCCNSRTHHTRSTTDWFSRLYCDVIHWLTNDSCTGVGVTLRCCLFVDSCGHIQFQQLRITLKRHRKNSTLFRTSNSSIHVRHSKWKLQYVHWCTQQRRIINIHEMHNTPLFFQNQQYTHPNFDAISLFLCTIQIPFRF